MNQSSPTPNHITKYASNYEERLIELLVNHRGMSRDSVLRERYKYACALDKSTAVSSDIDTFPLTVNIELLNKCNYKCSMCYTVNHDGDGVTLGINTAKNIIDECASNRLMTLFIANGSEPTICKDFKEIVKYATSLIPDVAVFTNAVKLDAEMTDFLIQSGITRLNISLDAARKETYKLIRGGDLDRIEENIRHFLQRRGSGKPPLVRVSFVEQPTNKHEATEFINKWSGIADSVEIQCLQDFNNIPSLPAIGNANELENESVLIDNHCYSPFSYIAIWSNGQISPCCSFHGTKINLGNIKQGDTISSAWNGEMMRSLRDQFSRSSVNSICADCLSCTDYEKTNKDI